MKVGCIFGTGCNAAYMENCGSIPKLAHMNLPPDTPMAINCEWGAFDNEHKVLPRTKYDIIIDKDSPRPGQQAFEKMIAGLYLGELFRLILVDLHDNHESCIFAGQDISKLRKAYSLDSSFLSAVEEYALPSHLRSPMSDVWSSNSFFSRDTRVNDEPIPEPVTAPTPEQTAEPISAPIPSPTFVSYCGSLWLFLHIC
jgi:hexokinase